MAATANAMKYGEWERRPTPAHIMLNKILSVRLGNSGLKVSKLILGTAMWGNPKFLPWSTIDEEAATEQVRVA